MTFDILYSQNSIDKGAVPKINNTKKIKEKRSLDDAWSNETCLAIALSQDFPIAVKDLDVQKSVTDRFLNFYLGGKVEKGYSISDIVFATIAIMPLTPNVEDFIWNSIHYDENGTLFFLTPEDKIKYDIAISSEKFAETTLDISDQDKNIDTLTETVGHMECGSENEAPQEELIAHNDKKVPDYNTSVEAEVDNENLEDDSENWSDTDYHDVSESVKKKRLERLQPVIDCLPENITMYTKSSTQVNVQLMQKVYGPLENAAFINSCNQLIETWHTNAKGRTVLKYLFGMVALTLMRGTTKTFKHLVNTFSTYKFYERLSFCDNIIAYSVPHKRCIKNSYRVFSKRDSKTGVMFAKIILNSFFVTTQLQAVTGDSRLNIFRLSVLAHTAGYGMGLVNLMLNVYKAVESISQFKIVVETTYSGLTAQSWDRLLKFMDKYNDSEESTHYWARVVNGDYFRSFSCGENYALSIVFAVFVERLTLNKGLWQSTWVTSSDKLDRYKYIGARMYQNYNYVITAPLRKKREEEMEKERAAYKLRMKEAGIRRYNPYTNTFMD